MAALKKIKENILLSLILIFISLGCSKETEIPKTITKVTINNPIEITPSTVTLTAEIQSDEEFKTGYFVINTVTSPTEENSSWNISAVNETSFSTTFHHRQYGTQYFVRAYLHIDDENIYSNEISFTTPIPECVTPTITILDEKFIHLNVTNEDKVVIRSRDTLTLAACGGEIEYGCLSISGGVQIEDTFEQEDVIIGGNWPNAGYCGSRKTTRIKLGDIISIKGIEFEEGNYSIAVEARFLNNSIEGDYDETAGFNFCIFKNGVKTILHEERVFSDQLVGNPLYYFTKYIDFSITSTDIESEIYFTIEGSGNNEYYDIGSMLIDFQK